MRRQLRQILDSRSPWLTATLLVGIGLVASVLPGAARFRPVTGAAITRTFLDPFRGRPRVALWTIIEEEAPLPVAPLPIFALAGQTQPAAAPGATPRPARANPIAFAQLPAPTVRDGRLALPSGVLEVPEGALDGFFAALGRAERGQGVCRIAHFGDSPVTGDLISGEARAHFQRAYGDAGHGFLLPGRPWEWYGHLGVAVNGKGWRLRSPMLGQREPLGGLAGVSFSTNGRATTTVECARWVKSTWLELHYLAAPDGGTLLVTIDDREPLEVSTREEDEGVTSTHLSLGDDVAHEIRLETRGDGPVTLFGLVLEREQPGVVYDALGANGGAIFHLASLDAGHWMSALEQRRPDLVILAYGTNESGYYANPGPSYVKAYATVVERIRNALPQTSILILAPMDRGEKGETGELGTLASLPRIVAAQRRAASELGCAFFDTYAAMGGEGAVVRWLQAGLMTSDLTHPTRAGADRLARLFVQALRTHYEAASAPPPTPEVAPASAPASTATPEPAEPGHTWSRPPS